MKIGSENSPLSFLETPPVTFGFTDLDLPSNKKKELISIVIEIFKNKDIVNAFKMDVCYWTEPFYEAYYRAHRSIVDAIYDNKVTLSGAYAGVSISKHRGIEFTTFYYLEIEHGLTEEAIQLESKKAYIMLFHNLQLTALYVIEPGEQVIEFIAPWYLEWTKEDKHQLLRSIVEAETFKKYCDLQIKILSPRARVSEISCSYLNKSKSIVKILDSKWFTTLVKSDAFNVRGHFRFQACGEGLKDRKLIWINEFMKEGYLAPAKKLK